MRETCHNAGFHLLEVIRLQNVVEGAELERIMRNFFIRQPRNENDAGAVGVAALAPVRLEQHACDDRT